MSKRERQRRRDRRRATAGKDYRTIEIGNGIETAAPSAVLEAFDRLPADLDWESLAGCLVPLLPRRLPMLVPAGEPIEVLLPPGIRTGFGLDIGPAFVRVDTSLVERWGVDTLTVVGRSLENLRARTRSVRPRDLMRERIDSVPVRVLQTGIGCASTLLLIEDELMRIFGTDPQVLIAPMRDLLVSMPADSDREFVAWLNEEFASLDPHGLALDAFSISAGSLRYEPLPGRSGAA